MMTARRLILPVIILVCACFSARDAYRQRQEITRLNQECAELADAVMEAQSVVTALMIDRMRVEHENEVLGRQVRWLTGKRSL